MATPYEPPRPPAPPPPPRAGSHGVAIALLILAVIAVGSVFAVWIGLRFLSSNVQVRVDERGEGKKDVSITTPVGKFEIKKDTNVGEAQLGLPIYPGAKRIKGDMDERGAVLNFQLPGQENLQIVAAKFETDDPIEKVRNFYKARLGTQVTKFVERDREGKTVLEVKHGDQEKVVALKRSLTGTRIELVHIFHGREETN